MSDAVSPAGTPSCSSVSTVTPAAGIGASARLNVTVDSGSAATAGAQAPLKDVRRLRPGSTASTVPVIMSAPPAV